MLSRISASQIAPTALSRIVPYRVFSRLGHPLPRSRSLLQIHQASYQIGIKTFSTTRPWFKKQREGDIFERLLSVLSASGRLSKEQEKEIERIEELRDHIRKRGYTPFEKGLALIMTIIIVLLPIGVGLMCVRWILRKVGILQDPQVAKEAKSYGDMNDDDQYGKE
jgi:hypothetical protein